MDGTGIRILVAESEPVTRMVLVETLQDAGYDVLEAAGGAEAIDLIGNPDHVDLVVADLDGAGPDSIDVAIQAQGSHPETPVLYITTRPDLLAAKHPPQPYGALEKPFTLAAVTQTIGKLLGR